MPVPFFSIIMPTHLRPQLLKRALKSLRANTFNDFEILVISDVNDHETGNVVADMLSQNDTFVRRPGQPGPAPSRNIGLELAKGQRILFLDDDDAFLPDFLGTAYELSSKDPKAAIYTNYQIIQENREQLETPLTASEYSVKGTPTESAYVKNFIHNHTVIYPANAVRHRRQDPRLSSLDDWDFLLNVMSEVEFVHANVSGPVIYKDYVNTGNRRGTTEGAKGNRVVLDYLSIYSKWPAPTKELKSGRQQLLNTIGLNLPVDWF